MRQVKEALAPASLTGPSRKFLASALTAAKGHYESLLIPASEQFDIARIALAVGWDADQIWCSDIGLVPRLLGHLVDGADHSPPAYVLSDYWEQHEVRLGADRTEEDRAAHLLWLIKRAQLSAGGFSGARVDHLDEHVHAHLSRLRSQITQQQQALAGVHFTSTDLREVVLTAGDGCLVVVDPPSSSTRFESDHAFHGAITYSAPASGFVWHREYPDLYATSAETAATALWFAAASVDRNLPDDDVVFAVEKKPTQVEKWRATKPIEGYTRGLVSFKRNAPEPYPAPVFGPDDRMDGDSEVRFVPVAANVTAYYRDLWAHKLPGTSGAEIHLLLLIDGKVAGICLCRISAVSSLTADYGDLVSGFMAPHPVYKRMSRLLNLLITSAQFKPVLYARQSVNRYFDIAGMRTTVFSKYRKTKVLNGVMEVLDRERLPNGTYRIRYGGPFRPDTFGQTVERFVREEAEHGET